MIRDTMAIIRKEKVRRKKEDEKEDQMINITQSMVGFAKKGKQEEVKEEKKVEPPKQKTPPKYESKKITAKLEDMEYAREMICKKIYVPKDPSPKKKKKKLGGKTIGDASSIGGATNFTQIMN